MLITVPLARRQLSIGAESVIHLLEIVDVHIVILSARDDAGALVIECQRGDLQWKQ